MEKRGPGIVKLLRHEEGAVLTAACMYVISHLCLRDGAKRAASPRFLPSVATCTYVSLDNVT